MATGSNDRINPVSPLYGSWKRLGRIEVIEQREHRLPDSSANILEIDIDSLRTGASQLRWKIGRVVIDRGVKPEFVFNIRTFLRPAGDADRPGARGLRELSDQRTDRSARGRDHHSFAGLRFANQAKAEPGLME